MSTIKVTVYEKNEPVDQNTYSGCELEALIQQIEGVWNTLPGANYSFSVELGEKEMHVQYKENGAVKPIPDRFKTANVWTDVNGLKPILGNQIQIEPPQYGVNPWPTDVRVQFDLDENGSTSGTPDTLVHNVYETYHARTQGS